MYISAYYRIAFALQPLCHHFNSGFTGELGLDGSPRSLLLFVPRENLWGEMVEIFMGRLSFLSPNQQSTKWSTDSGLIFLHLPGTTEV